MVGQAERHARPRPESQPVPAGEQLAKRNDAPSAGATPVQQAASAERTTVIRSALSHVKQPSGSVAHLVVRNAQCRACGECRPDLPDGRIERERGDVRRPVCGVMR